MNIAGFIFSLLNAAHGAGLPRDGPSPAQKREVKRIVAHRARNWLRQAPLPQSKAHYLPLLRKGGGQRGVGT